MAAEIRVAGAGLDIALQGIQIVRETGVVLGVELHHPRVFVQLVKTVLQGVFQGVAGLGQPSGFAAFGADRQ